MKTVTFKVKNRQTGAVTQSTIPVRKGKPVIEAAREANRQGGVLESFLVEETQSGLGNKNWRGSL